MGGHVFLDHMPFRMTCVMIVYVLREVMLCCRECLMEGHACLQDDISYNMFILLKDMSYWRLCLLDGRYYRRACIAVGDVLLGYVHHVFHEKMCCGWSCHVGLCRSNHLCCYEFRHLVFFFFLQ